MSGKCRNFRIKNQKILSIFINMKQKILGAGILAFDKSTGRVLLGRRGMDTGMYDRNCYSPFGGTFEKKDGNPRTTAIREFSEETGCQVPYQLSKKPFFINDDNHVKFYTYIGIFEKEFPVKINNESLDYCWFDIKSLPENLHPGVKEMFSKRYEDLKAFADYISR